MTNFEEFKQKAKDTMETLADKSIELYKVAEEKTKLLAKTTKLAAEITLEKGALRRLYREIGQKYYELHKEAPETALEQMCVEVTSSLETIASKQQEIESLRNAYEASRNGEDDSFDDIEVEIILRDLSDAEASGRQGETVTQGSPEDPEENTAQADNVPQ
jgi:glutaredoxin 2